MSMASYRGHPHHVKKSKSLPLSNESRHKERSRRDKRSKSSQAFNKQSSSSVFDKIEKEFGCRSKKIDAYEFYHGKLPRDECSYLLTREGDFLLRESYDECAQIATIVLTIFTNKNLRNFIGYAFEAEPYPTIIELIAYHYFKSIPITRRTGVIIKRPVKRADWEIHSDQIIELPVELGRGNFGLVKKGVFYSTSKDGKKVGEEVALKQCHATLPNEEKKKFLQEARILRRYSHPNIVRFIGVCTWKDPLMIIMEYIQGGSLRGHLQSHRDRKETIKLKILVHFCLDTAYGMEYLASKECLHRDLAARNCLLGGEDKLTIKITDFGMSREGQTYEIPSDGQLPIKWTAPEAIQQAVITSQSDVWSYGVLIWEIFSHGLIPYGKLNNKEVIQNIARGFRVGWGWAFNHYSYAFLGERLQVTAGTPEEFATLMHNCWNIVPHKRPNFTMIREICQAYYDQI